MRLRARPHLPLAAMLALAAAVVPVACLQTPARQTLRVPMRDGTRLATDVYLPPGNGPFPVVLLRTPYNKDGMAPFAGDATKRGYAVVVQDTRGRFASEGANLPFEGDGWFEGRQDGYDTLEWLAAQRWCNGRIGTFGGSALGITQLLAAGSGSQRIGAQIVMVAAPSFYFDCVYPGGVFRKSLVEDWLRATNHSPQALKAWTSHPTYDAYWRERDLAGRWSRVNAPAIHIGGWYDIFAQGTIDSFLGYQKQGGPRARGKQRLIMGPWTHGILQERAGVLRFPNGKEPPNGAHDPWRWYDAHLKGDGRGAASVPAVTYYVMGDTANPSAPGNEWRTSDRWPPAPYRDTPYYLTEEGGLVPLRPKRAASRAFVYDPANPAPTVGGNQLSLPAGPMDQRRVEARPDVLLFSTQPLREPVEVTGRVRARLWVSTDGPDTDFFVRLCDVYPDGRSYNVCEGQLRCRFREGFQTEKPMAPGKVVPIVVDLWSTSIVFNRGHRIRVQVTSSSAPGFDPNPNTGEPFRATTKVRVARNSVWLGGAQASHIDLPVVIGRPGR